MGVNGVVSREPLNNSLHTQSFRLVRNLGAFLKVYVHPSKKRNNECGPAWKTRRARPEAPICCALPLGKGATLTIETRHNSCTLQVTLSMQGVIQRFPSCELPGKETARLMCSGKDVPAGFSRS